MMQAAFIGFGPIRLVKSFQLLIASLERKCLFPFSSSPLFILLALTIVALYLLLLTSSSSV